MVRVKKYYYIYIVFNIINDRFYVGQRGCNCVPEKDTKYLGSGCALRNAFVKYGIENFSKEIIEICTVDDVDEKEKFYIKYFDARNKKAGGYNLREGGHTGGRHHESTLVKIGNIRRGVKLTEKQRDHLKVGWGWNKGLDATEEARRNQSKGQLNQAKLTCPHCFKTMNVTTSKRYHFDKCKFKTAV